MQTDAFWTLDPLTLMLVVYLLGTAVCGAGALAWQPIERWLGR
jgi:hypothetical protein